MAQLLKRLPVKSLLRFTCVSKNWCSTICTPEFAKFHLSSSTSSHQLLFRTFNPVTSRKDSNFFLLSYDDYNNVTNLVALDYPNKFPSINNIVGSCNGLVCLYFQGTHDKSFALWNPATHEHCYISNPNGMEYAFTYGFGYVPSLDDYKIVAAFSRKNHEYDKVSEFYVFSSRTSRWKRIRGLDEHVNTLQIIDAAVLVDDTFYWCPRKLSHYKIAGYNLVTEELTEIPWMNWLREYNWVNLYVIKGCLSFYCSHCGGSDVWVLKKKCDWNSWEKLSPVKFKGMFFVDFSETGKCLVASHAQLMVVDPSQEGAEHFQRGIDFDDYIQRAVDYVENLNSLSGLIGSFEG